MTDHMPADPEGFAVPGLEIREPEERVIVGRIIPYGQQIRYRGKLESFTRGAVAGLNPADTVLLRWHDGQKPIGRMTGLEERDDGAYGTFKVAKTAAGDEALQLAAEGVLDALSPGFIPGEQTAGGIHRQLRALPEVSLVTWGAYKNARVLAVRETEVETVTEPATQPAVDLGPIETRLDGLTQQITEMRTVIDAPAGQNLDAVPTALEWFQAELEAKALGKYERRQALAEKFARALETRALEDITGTLAGTGDASGLVVEQYIGAQLVNVLDVRRPLIRSFGSFPMPRSGYAKIPVVTQHTEVAARAGQKLAANSRKLIVVPASFEAEWYDGAVDVALEIIRSSELPVLAMIWEDLLGQYAIATEAGIAAAIETGTLGFTYTGTALDTATYGGFASDVAEQAIQVQKVSGAPATKLAVTETQWPILVAMVDANDRRQFAPIGSQNADAQVSLNAQSFTLPGGVDVFYAAGITQAMLYNEQSLRVADGGPERVEATNVELMGQDVGILGRVMFVPRIPAAVRVFGTDPTP